MGILCEVQLNEEHSVYKPGQTISGRVIVALEDRVLIKGLGLQVSGYAATCWEKPQKPQKPKKQKSTKKSNDLYIENTVVVPKEYYNSRHDYISTTNYFIGSEEAFPKIITTGRYAYTFCVRLPQNCVSSFESTLGHIRYELQVFIDYADHKHICYSKNLLLRKTYDLREKADLWHTQDFDNFETKHIFKFWQKPLHLTVNIPHRGYIKGETISVHVKIFNYDDLKLKAIIYKLNMLATYRGIWKKKTETKVLNKNLLNSVHSLDGISDQFVQHLQVLEIPQEITPSTSFKDCECIQVSYEVEVLVTTSKRKRKLAVSLPVEIGTISLKNSESVSNTVEPELYPSLRQENFEPTAPLPSPDTPVLSKHLTMSMTSLASSFKEADFMTSTNLNKKSKHTMSGENLDFKPKYLYYDYSTESISNAVNEEEEEEHDNVACSSRNVSNEKTAL